MHRRHTSNIPTDFLGKVESVNIWREWAREKQPELERDVMAHVQREWGRAWWGMFGFEERKA